LPIIVAGRHRGRARRGPKIGPLSHLRGLNYFSSTVAPASSSFFLTAAASSLPMFSLTALGAPSTRSFASFRPSPVSSRTVLMTLIFDAPASLRMTENSVFSSTSAGAAAPAAPPAAATATGAADTPQRSCRYLPNWAVSSIDQDSSSPASLSNLGLPTVSGVAVAVAIVFSFLFRTARLEHADEISLGRGEHADHLRERSLQAADDRRLKLRPAREPRERGDVVRAHRAAADERTEDP